VQGDGTTKGELKRSETEREKKVGGDDIPGEISK
jgi:hypothetical protein